MNKQKPICDSIVEFVSRQAQHRRVVDSNKRLEEYILGSLRASGLETMADIKPHKDGLRIALQTIPSVYVDAYLDGQNLIVEGADKNAMPKDAQIEEYAKFAGIPVAQAKSFIARFMKWLRGLQMMSGDGVDRLEGFKVSDAAAKRFAAMRSTPNAASVKDGRCQARMRDDDSPVPTSLRGQLDKIATVVPEEERRIQTMEARIKLFLNRNGKEDWSDKVKLKDVDTVLVQKNDKWEEYPLWDMKWINALG